MDGFHARCVRKIVGIQPSYWSRVTNLEVLALVHGQQLSILLLQQQLGLFGKIFRKPFDDVVRRAVFEVGSDEVKMHSKRMRKGRPKLYWATELHKIAVQISGGGGERLQKAMANVYGWKAAVKYWCQWK